MPQTRHAAYDLTIRRLKLNGRLPRRRFPNKIAPGRFLTGDQQRYSKAWKSTHLHKAAMLARAGKESMMMIDAALQELESIERPIRVGMIGAGATGRAIALQLGTPVPGIRLVAIANRTPERAERAFREANITDWSRVDSAQAADAA